MNLTRERIRQVEVKALAKLEALRNMMALRDFVDEGPVGRRRLPKLSKDETVGPEYRDEDEDETDSYTSAETDDAEPTDVASDFDLEQLDA